MTHKLPHSFFVKLTHEYAVLPSRAHPDDVGLDLTIVDWVKEVGDVTFFDTGIQVAPPTGFYFEVVPRSSLSKTNWIMTNSVGVIDPGYRGNILIPLRRVGMADPSEILGNRVAQLILRELHYASPVSYEGAWEETVRGEGGFGSTGA